ncbi:protein argonaute 2 [Sesamum angolense]|uniref:Protein argonaute 2 n=1 Tax=Sesamum angolense TaxID=2727404 RepID=A0AAE1WTZ9_9LAMI|nr:protein argonaute 2 [Sesamum angolense]
MDSGRSNYGRGRGRGRGRGPGNYQNQPHQGGGSGDPSLHPGSPPQAWGNQPPPPQLTSPGPVAGRGVWTGRPWGPFLSSPSPSPSTSPSSSSSPSPSSVQPLSPPQKPPKQSADELGVQKLKISEQEALPSSPLREENQIQPMRRPHEVRRSPINPITLLVNHFPVKFDPERTINHYHVDVKLGDKTVRKSDMPLIKEKLFSDDPWFQNIKAAYDGDKNIFSSVHLPQGQFKVDFSGGEEIKSGSYMCTIKFVNELMLSKLNDYMTGGLPDIPRDILHGMDLFMQENPSRRRISLGRSFYSLEYRTEYELGYGFSAGTGFQQSLKPTSQGLALCLDYSAVAIPDPVPVLDFLNVHLEKGVAGLKKSRQLANDALEGLKVTVTHRRTKQKYTIAGLTTEVARDSSFEVHDPKGKNPPEEIRLVKYFKDKWGQDIMYPDLPCLELGTQKKSNKVPLEFCVLVEGQRYPRERLPYCAATWLKNLSVCKPYIRMKAIDEMVRAEDGPCGPLTRDFRIEVDTNMTKVVGRVIGAPLLKLGIPRTLRVDGAKCQWNLVGRTLVDGKTIVRWALLDFTNGDSERFQADTFVYNLLHRCKKLGIKMAKPMLSRVTRVDEFSCVDELEKLLGEVLQRCWNLQMIVCVMTKPDPRYKYLKWVSETRIGVVTQCCCSKSANSGKDQYFANLCLKINAKLGGSNFELAREDPHFDIGEHVMFIGADVNHPGPKNVSCPSIAAVVGTVNWPAANRYAARVGPQEHRREQIINFGAMCLDLVKTYVRLNNIMPKRIVVFRDGVSEAQFVMVLNKELLDLRRVFYNSGYQPKITVVVAQKRHQTRLFVEDEFDNGMPDNVPPGTVVDTTIVHPRDYDFYLCSHYGSIGTSKPTHYHVLLDENSFTSDDLQRLIYEMCFTYVRCTKPVSLVPPVYYADRVAYRGRMFQEVLMRNPTLASSATSSDSMFYTVHPHLKDTMFFV